MRILKKFKKVGCAMLAIALIMTACFPYGAWVKASTTTDTTITQIYANANGNFFTFKLDGVDWGAATSLTAPGITHYDYSFWQNIRLYQGEEDTTGTTLWDASDKQIYYNFFDSGNTAGICILSDIYAKTTKIVIPAGTAFPSYKATGGTTPFNGVDGDDVAADANGTTYVIKDDLSFVGGTDASSGVWEYWKIVADTTVDTLDIKDGRMVFNIAGDADNDALTEWTYIWQATHDEYNFKDNIEIYISGESQPKTLRDIFKTSDGNLYWNLYEAGSMSIPLTDGSYDCTRIEKIVVKKGCEFPSVASTGGNSLQGGSGVTATLESDKAYVVQGDLIFVPRAGASETKASFMLMDTSETTDTAVIGVKTGHNNKNVTFTLSATDYAGCVTNRPSKKYADYNFMELIQIHSGDAVQTLMDVYSAGEEMYYNLWGMENTFTIALGASYDTVTKIVIPKGTVFPSAAYTGYGAWDQFDIPENNVKEKCGFETTEEVVYTKPAGTGELNWTLEESDNPDEPDIPIEPDEPVPGEDVETDVTNIHIRYGENEGYRLLFFLNAHDYSGANVPSDAAKVADYNVFESVFLVTTTGEEISLSDAYDNVSMYNIWNEAGSFSVKLKAGIAPICKVVIKENCQFPARAYTEGTSGKYAYVVKSETIFTTSTTPTDNKWSVHWSKQKVLPKKEVKTDVTNIHIRSGENEGARLLLFLNMHDYGEELNVTAQGDFFDRYNTLNNIVLYTTAGEEYVLADIYDNVSMFNIWGEVGTFSVLLKKDIQPIEKVVIKANCEIPSKAFTEGKGEYQIAYTVPFETVFTANTIPADNIATVHWTKVKNLPTVAKDTEVMKAQFIGREGDVRLLLFLDKQDYKGIGNSVFTTSKFKQYNTLENVILCRGDRKISLSEIVTDEVYYNLWGNEGCISYGLKDEYTLNSFDKVFIKSGCEFPAYAYTANENAEQMTAYTTTKEKTITVTQAKYKLTYYDENEKVLYEEELPFGTGLILKAVPKKKGYEGKWEGLKYETMPAQDISYYASYTKGTKKEKDKEIDEEQEKEPDNEQSPVTGDWNMTSFMVLLLLSSAFVILLTLKKRDIVGGRNERQ